MTRNDGAFEVWVVACKDAEITWIISFVNPDESTLGLGTPEHRPRPVNRRQIHRIHTVGEQHHVDSTKDAVSK
jgi:hypothetical protein